MFVNQLSVFIENREGRLDKVLATLKDNDINIVSLSLADTSDYGLLRMIVSDPEKGKAALKEAKAVFADKNATQEDVDGAVKVLQASVDGLKTPGTTDNKKPGTTDSNKKPAKTGDATTSVAWGFAGIAAALAAVVAFFERKRRRQ